MTSKEIFEERKMLIGLPLNEQDNKRELFIQLQKQCRHMWDTEVDAIFRVDKSNSMCTICGKLFKNI